MTVALAFVAGCVVGWTAYRLFWKYGMRLATKDRNTAHQLLDGLGYSSLLKLQSALNDELTKRRAA